MHVNRRRRIPPQDTDSYLALPWLFKIAHKALACRCKVLGLGHGCCLRENTEIPLVGLSGEKAAASSKQQATPSISLSGNIRPISATISRLS